MKDLRCCAVPKSSAVVKDTVIGAILLFLWDPLDFLFAVRFVKKYIRPVLLF